MHQKWKEMTGEFSKKSPTFFLERRRYYPNLKSVTSGGEV